MQLKRDILMDEGITKEGGRMSKSKMQLRVEGARERLKEVDVDELKGRSLAYFHGVIQVLDWLLDPEMYTDPVDLLNVLKGTNGKGKTMKGRRSTNVERN